ncbi:MAG: SLBB domain-containing protein [Planctomycetota bacterium]
MQTGHGGRWARGVGTLGLALALMVAPACQTKPLAPARHPGDVRALMTESVEPHEAGFTAIGAAELNGIHLEDPGPYRLGIGDVVHVTVPGSVDFKGFGETSQGDIVGTRVKDDGNVYLPILRVVPAAGRTALELQEDVRQRLDAGPLKGALVSVDVIEHRSQTCYVFGQVAKPGAVAVDGRLTLRDAIGRAGGVDMAEAGLEEAYVVREGQHVLPVSLADVFYRAHPFGGLRLRQGDVVFVPHRRDRASHVYVLGEVNSPRAIEMRRGVGPAGEPTPARMTLADAIAEAGGLKRETADHDCVRIFRGTCGDVRAFTISAHEIWRYGEGILLHPGDRVLVAPTAEADYRRALEAAMPLLQGAGALVGVAYAADALKN